MSTCRQRPKSLLFLSINGSIVSAVMNPESSSTSANTGFEASIISEAVASNVLGVVITSSFSFNPIALYAAANAREPLPIAIAFLVPPWSQIHPRIIFHEPLFDS